MKKVFSFICLFFFLTVSFGYPVVKIPEASKVVPVKTQIKAKGLSAQDLQSIITLAHNEGVIVEKVADLANGALNGVYTYLKGNKIKYGTKRYISLKTEDTEALKQFSSIYNTILSNHPQINREKISYFAARGIMKKLEDPYAMFLDPKDFKTLQEQMKGGDFGGVGVYLEIDNKKKILKIVSAIEDTPAEKGGIKKGDIITAVNGKAIKNMSSPQKAKDMLRGEPGSKVTLTVKRSSLSPFDVTLTREIINVKTLTYKMFDDKIGYIRLGIFGENTADELRKALDDLERKGALGYIFDLRENAGGYVNAAVHVASEFLPTGKVIVTQTRQQHKKNTPYISLPNIRSSVPTLVLIDKGSASASEITAGALKDYKTAVVMGTTSFGKGRIQKVFPLPNETAMKFTTSYYLTPKGHSIDKKGISPDITVKQPDNKPVLNEQQDAALNAAKKHMLKKVSDLTDGKTGETLSDSLNVRSNEDLFAKLSKVVGPSYEIINSELILQDGKLYEKVTVVSDGKEKTVYFDRGESFSTEVK